MNGFALSGKIVEIEKKILKTGNPMYRIVVEDPESATQSKPAKRYEIKVIGNLARNLNEYLFKRGVSVFASGVLDTFEKSGFINLSLTALCLIPVLYKKKEEDKPDEIVSEVKNQPNDDGEIIEDDLPF